MFTTSMNFCLGDEIEALRDMAHRFAQTEIKPLAEEIDRTNEFPREQLWTKLGDQGLLGVTVEEEYGGSQMGYLAHCVAMEEISRGGTATRHNAKNTYRNSSPANTSAHSPCLNPALDQTSCQ
jgi:isovaleryl-CoA dehydrogenase